MKLLYVWSWITKSRAFISLGSAFKMSAKVSSLKQNGATVWSNCNHHVMSLCFLMGIRHGSISRDFVQIKAQALLKQWWHICWIKKPLNFCVMPWGAKLRMEKPVQNTGRTPVAEHWCLIVFGTRQWRPWLPKTIQALVWVSNWIYGSVPRSTSILIKQLKCVMHIMYLILIILLK
jgi:hypothetical protein